MENNLFESVYEDGINSPTNGGSLYFRVGVILKVYDEESLNNVNERDGYLSVAVQWLDGIGGYGYADSGFAKLSIHFPSPNDIDVPNKWDIVICGFRQGGYAVIVGYLDRQTALQALGIQKIEDLPGFFSRKLISGECYKKSKQGAETYYDRQGGLHFLIREQTTTHPVKIFQEQFETVDDNPTIEMTLGKTYGLKSEGNVMAGKEYSQVQNYDFSDEQKLSSGASTKFSIRDLKTGTQILIGTDGNIEVITSGKLQITTQGDTSITTQGKTEINSADEINITSESKVNIEGTPTINLNGESLSVAIAEKVALGHNAHFHLLGTVPTTTPTTPMGVEIASQKVKIGG